MGPCKACGSRISEGLYCLTCERQLGIGPAPKEEEMTIHTGGVRTDVELPPHIIGPAPILDGQPRALERRALAREAYMAALGGLMGLAAEVDCGIPGLVRDAEMASIETVRRWDAFMAAVDAEGGE